MRDFSAEGRQFELALFDPEFAGELQLICAVWINSPQDSLCRRPARLQYFLRAGKYGICSVVLSGDTFFPRVLGSPSELRDTLLDGLYDELVISGGERITADDLNEMFGNHEAFLEKVSINRSVYERTEDTESACGSAYQEVMDAALEMDPELEWQSAGDDWTAHMRQKSIAEEEATRRALWQEASAMGIWDLVGEDIGNDLAGGQYLSCDRKKYTGLFDPESGALFLLNPTNSYGRVHMNAIVDGERFGEEEIRLSGPMSCHDVRYIYAGRRVKEIDLPTDRTLLDKVEEYCFLKRSMKIEYAEFDNWTSLKHIHIPDHVREIGVCAFRNCISLKKINIPNALTSINGSAFEGCGPLDIEIREDHPVFRVVDGQLCTRDGRLVRAFVEASQTKYRCPEGVTEIGEVAFSGCCHLEEIEFPDSVKKIHDRAFRACTALQKVTLPDSLQSIGAEAFKEAGIRELRIPESCGDTELPHLFGRDQEVDRIILPASVRKIEKDALSGCRVIEYEGARSDWERIGYESSAPTWYAVSEDGAKKRTTLIRKRAEEVPFSEKFKMEFCRLMGREEQNNYCKITESRVNYR